MKKDPKLESDDEGDSDWTVSDEEDNPVGSVFRNKQFFLLSIY